VDRGRFWGRVESEGSEREKVSKVDEIRKDFRKCRKIKDVHGIGRRGIH